MIAIIKKVIDEVNYDHGIQYSSDADCDMTMPMTRIEDY